MRRTPRIVPSSLRARATLLASLVSGTALLLGAVLLQLTLERSLHRSGDSVARGRVQDLAALVRQEALPPVLGNVGGEGVAQVFRADGTVLSASPNITGRPPVTTDAGSTTPVLRVLRGAPDEDEKEDYRVWTARAAADGPVVTVVVGASLESVGEASLALRRGLAIGLPLLEVLVALGTWVLVGRTLRPVEDIRSEVAAISESDLARRVPEPPSGDEVARLAVTMNQMLDRLEQSSRRQRDFVSDASHELQSPLTALRTQLEVALATEVDDWPEVARSLLADTDEMERLVRDLLFLARTREVSPAHPDLVDLDDLVLEEAARLRPRVAASIDTTAVSAAPVLGDTDDLRRLVRNLLENAVRHAAGRVVLRLGAAAGVTRLTVADDGPGVPVSDRERVFDRFVGGDPARARGAGHGLGLAIAREIALRHGGGLLVTDEPALGGAAFEVTLPVPAPGSPPERTTRSVVR